MPLTHAMEASRMAPGSGPEAQGEALLAIRDLSVDFSVEGRTISPCRVPACPCIR